MVILVLFALNTFFVLSLWLDQIPEHSLYSPFIPLNTKGSHFVLARVLSRHLDCPPFSLTSETRPSHFGSPKEKVHLLKSYGLAPHEVTGQPSVPDPIGKPLEVYEVCFAEIREAVERLAKSLGVRSVDER